MKVSLKDKRNTTWFVVAIEDEFVSDKHNVIYVGPGKINAAMGTQWLIDNYKVSEIINIGTAGGNPKKVEKGKVYNIGRVWDRDWKTPNHPNGLEIILKKDKRLKACYTGDSFVTSWDNDYDLVDMEAFAIASVCLAPQNNIKFSCYKYISDTGSDDEWIESLVKCNQAFNKMFK